MGDRGARTVAAAFVVSTVASLGLAVTYWRGGHTQLEGLLLGLSLGGIAAGLIVWAKRMMPQGPDVEDREDLASEVPATEELGASTSRVGRRAFLATLLGAALGALGLAALFPIRSLGSRPGGALFVTAWRRGSRLVTADGTLVRADDVGVGSVLTVFPEGHTDAGDVAALLIHLEPEQVHEPEDRRGWAPDGLVAYSKICTHAGCPVGLYQAASQELLCPCHQSSFSVTQGAVPTSGPATRPLPQLPLRIADDGILVADGDFSDPIGPGFWNVGREDA